MSVNENELHGRLGLAFDCLNSWLQVALIVDERFTKQVARNGTQQPASDPPSILIQKQGRAGRDTFQYLTAWIEEVCAPYKVFASHWENEKEKEKSSPAPLAAPASKKGQTRAAQKHATAQKRTPLECIVIPKRDGSFTGMRLAANTASSLAQLLEIPVYWASALDYYYLAAQKQMKHMRNMKHTHMIEGSEHSSGHSAAAADETHTHPVLFVYRYGQQCYCKHAPHAATESTASGTVPELVEKYQLSSAAPIWVDSQETATLVAQAWPLDALGAQAMNPRQLQMHIHIMAAPSLLCLWELARQSPPLDWQGCSLSMVG